MNKQIFLSLIIILILSLFITTCKDSNEQSSVMYRINTEYSEYGSISILGGIKESLPGKEVTFYINENFGFNIDTLTVSRQKSGTKINLIKNSDNTFSFLMPDDNVLISAVFVIDENPGEPKFKINIGDNFGGNISINEGLTEAPSGKNIFITLIPDPGFTYGTIIIQRETGFTPVQIGGAGDTRNFIMPFSNITVSAIFEDAQRYTINIMDPFLNGTITSDKLSTFAGDTVTLTASPDNNYITSLVRVNRTGTNVLIRVNGGDNIRSFVMPNSNVNINASFMRLIWSDEFTGSSLDLNKWNIEQGRGSQYGVGNWGNGELQHYQDSNIRVRDGNLILEARSESVGTANYTSARITTGQVRDGTTTSSPWISEKYSVKTGRVEARIKTPNGVGFWPAFWLLGSNSYGAIPAAPFGIFPRPAEVQRQGWPSCGEIDILEFVGGQETRLVNAIHYGPNNANHSSVTSLTSLPSGAKFSDGWHTYGVIWDTEGIQFLLNGEPLTYHRYGSMPQRSTDNPTWMQNFYNDAGFAIILNIAIGGNMGGGTPSLSSFNGVDNVMLVDWVRVYAP